ncbi:uncharacterized protein LACBIDRAFT_303342 [Laccaria bicolor S238N-H82]|uniref:Predicted protein n=1 Tax=Laccaria bicolor (strain S238N-H82 / ATCC MYA-4686) TaxID=486041 RepID=B0DJC5_LACBS|nr:uncharacterized protein LACBIDRAFT_303342 [Laccaria bicolor S238N-H82]EDR05382.1 predicted protein [Laccaria bicolor S238N-H82]|eukprot:XP_001883940.1 predicted protein [Laccaria bicolor S238N-H82]
MNSNQQVRTLRPRGERKRYTETRCADSVLEDESDSFSSDSASSSSGEENRDDSVTHHIRKRKALAAEHSGTQVYKRQKIIGGSEVASESKKACRRRKPAMQKFFTAAREEKYEEPSNGATGQFQTQLQRCQTESDAGQHSHNSCGLLEFMDFTYLEALQLVACRQHETILPLESIKPHIDRRHPLGLPRNLKWHKIEEMLAHLKVAFPCAGTSFENIALPKSLATPLEGFSQESIRYRFMCPEAGCGKWIVRNDIYNGGPKAEFHHHLSVHHGKNTWPKNVEGSWVQAIRIHSATKSQSGTKHYFHLDRYQPPQSWHVIQPSFPTKSFSAPPNATWFKELQWCMLREKIQHIPFHEVKKLIAPPSRQLLQDQSRDSKRRLETALLSVRKHITKYVDHGQQFIGSIHEIYRIGLRPTEETNLAIFRTIKTANIKHYRGPLVKVVALLLRLYEYSQLGTPQEKKLASLLLDAEILQSADLKRLWGILNKTEGRDPKDYIPRSLHKLLASLLCYRSLPEANMACPTEMLLFLNALTESGYNTAASVKGVCCKLQFNFRIIFLHIVRLEAKMVQEYEPFNKGPPPASGAEEEPSQPLLEPANSDGDDDDSSDGDDDDSSDGDDDDSSDGDDDDENDKGDDDTHEDEMNDEPLDVILKAVENIQVEDFISLPKPEGECLAKAFKKYQKYVLGKSKMDYITPFQRNTHVWMIVAAAANKEPVGAQLNVSMIDDLISVSHGSDQVNPPKTISIRDWSATSASAMVEFQNSVERLLPDGVDISNFPLEVISDDLISLAPVHKQSVNEGALQPWTDRVYSAFMDPSESRHRLFSGHWLTATALDQWLKLEQTEVLTSLAKVFSLCCGIGIPEFKFGYIIFDPPPGCNRNIWLLKNGLFAFNDPTKSYGRSDTMTRFFAIPRGVTRHLAVFLYVLRPFGIRLLKLQQRHVPYYSSNIWALVQRSRYLNGQNDWLWSGRRIAMQIKVITNKFFGVTLTPTLIREIVFRLTSQYLPCLLNGQHYSPVDQQAQHSMHTSLCHYGWVSHFPPIEQLRLNHPARQLAVSEIWQAILRLGPMNDGWSGAVTTSQLTKGLFRRMEAIQIARCLIFDKYGVRSSASALKVLGDLPFVVCDTDHFGDTALVQVTRALITSIQKIHDGSVAEPNVSDVAEAAALITQELQQFASNEPLTIGMGTSNALLEYTSLYTVLLKYFAKNSLSNENAWIKFQSDVTQNLQ